jgi:TPR repeat protein
MMPTAFNEKDHADCAAAKQFVHRAMRISDETAREELMERAYQLLVPLVAKQLPAAQYLYACHFLSRECEREQDIERRYIELTQAAAHGGHAAAQFRLGEMFDSGGELGHDAEQSARWFRLSAEQGDCYAQWVHGLNLLSGAGLAQDQALGLKFIERAAAGKFEGALAFLAEAYATGDYGYPKDEKQAESYRHRMLEADVIGF